MPSVLFWIGQHGGTAQYRCITPGKALQRKGWDVAFAADALEMSADGSLKDDADIVVMCRTMGDKVPDVVRFLRNRGKVVVYDADDWFRGIPDYNPASRLSKQDIDSMHKAMSLADLISCSTPELAEGYSELGRTAVLPNYLDPDIWTGNKHYRAPRTQVHLGWMGAFAWRAGDLELLRPWLPRFLQQHPEVTFVALGCRDLLDYLGVDGLTTPPFPGMIQTGVNKDLYPYEYLPAMIAWLDIGLIPLTYNRFNQAKSWCKGLEYNSMGVPAIASPSREYRRYIQPGANGYLVRHNEWSTTVERALNNLAALREGSPKVADQYYIDQHIDSWVDAYESVRTSIAC